jgi:hypothetical protein
MGKNQDPGSGIRDKHPGSATLLSCNIGWATLVQLCIVLPLLRIPVNVDAPEDTHQLHEVAGLCKELLSHVVVFLQFANRHIAVLNPEH